MIKIYWSLSQRLFTLCLMLVLSGSALKGQNDYEILGENWLQYTDAPNSLYHYIAGQAFDMLSIRSKEISRISSLTEWQQRQKVLGATLLEIVGPFPEKTPLNARILRTIERDTFRIEHIVFESQPGFTVTSSLFIPRGVKKNKKFPVIIYCSGHAADGYRGEVYQHVILNLVRKGFIVFAFDPVGQGERLEYYDPKSGKSIVGGPTTEHSYPGTQAFITGSSEARYMIWDGIRAVDYLLTRKEVDPERIGITGRSGGGTQSAYIAAMDQRIYAAAPECYITNFTRLLQTIGNQDAEQNLFNEISRGIDHGDLLAVRAPKPALMITTTRDMFSIQGAMETEKEVSLIYKSYGMERNFGRVEDDYPHASTKKNREAMYSFFQEHLKNPGNSQDESVKILTTDEMRVTPTGQVSTSLGGETVYSLNRKEAEKLELNLKAARSASERQDQDVLTAAKILSGYHEPAVNDNPVFSGRYQKEGYCIEKYFVKGEGNYIIPYLLMKPSGGSSKAVIILHPGGKAAVAAEGGEMEWFVRQGFTVLAPDIVGAGEMGPGVFRGDAYIEGGSHNLWYASILIGRSIVGIRAADVVKLTGILKRDGKVNEVSAVSIKEMAPVLIHAAAFDQSITRIALIQPYSSYLSIVKNHYYSSSFIPGVVPGALKAFDIPDIEAALAPRKLMMAGVTDGYGKTDDSAAINDDLEVVRNGYRNKNAEGNLMIFSLTDYDDPNALFGDWIK
ncbi:MAG: acetylxylan esterase [Bacteroidales bacterium]|nr:acetylxylan esterase [Bacteroidales bacterium]